MVLQKTFFFSIVAQIKIIELIVTKRPWCMALKIQVLVWHNYVMNHHLWPADSSFYKGRSQCLGSELNQNKTTSKITQFTVFQLILNCGPRGSNSFFTRILVLRINYNNITTNGSSEDFFFFSIVAQIKIIELIVTSNRYVYFEKKA
jgi:hypothetical protein